MTEAHAVGFCLEYRLPSQVILSCSAVLVLTTEQTVDVTSQECHVSEAHLNGVPKFGGFRLQIASRCVYGAISQEPQSSGGDNLDGVTPRNRLIKPVP